VRRVAQALLPASGLMALSLLSMTVILAVETESVLGLVLWGSTLFTGFFLGVMVYRR